MYFVSTKREGFVMFSMTPSERFAIGLTEEQNVRLLEQSGGQWKTLREWPSADYSHTTLMAGLRLREEPSDASEWLALLPERLR